MNKNCGNCDYNGRCSAQQRYPHDSGPDQPHCDGWVGLKTLHVYSQAGEHREAFIVGDPAALKALRDAVGRALTRKDSSFTAYAADGEGYTTVVVCREADDPVWVGVGSQLRLPYTARPHDDDDLTPFDLLEPERYRKLAKGEDPDLGGWVPFRSDTEPFVDAQGYEYYGGYLLIRDGKVRAHVECGGGPYDKAHVFAEDGRCLYAAELYEEDYEGEAYPYIKEDDYLVCPRKWCEARLAEAGA